MFTGWPELHHLPQKPEPRHCESYLESETFDEAKPKQRRPKLIDDRSENVEQT